jgi:mRNA-degrading endonuclease RelE of RelBE toxin-antitoxin system
MRFHFTRETRAGLRAIPKEEAMRILHALTAYGKTGEGDIKQLQGMDRTFRLRIGDWRVIFKRPNRGLAVITRVAHRSDAYR